MALRGNSGQCSRNRNKVCSMLSGDKKLLPCRVPLSDSVVIVQSPSVSDSLWPHGLQHAGPSCPSPSPRVCPSSFSLHWGFRPAVNSLSDTLFSFSLQSFLASGTFPMNCLFTSDDQNTGASTSASVFSVNIQGWSALRLTGLISLLSKGLSGIFSSTTVWRHQFFGAPPSLWSSSYNCTWPLGTFVGRVMSLLFNILSRFVIAFLPRSSHLLISCLQSPSALILEHKRKSVTTSTFSPSICHAVHGDQLPWS